MDMDSMLVSILQTLTEGKQIEGRCTGKLNLIPGCDFNTGDYREYKRILKEFGILIRSWRDIGDTSIPPATAPILSMPAGQTWRTPPTRSTARPPSPSDPMHTQDLWLDQGQLLRQACLPADADGY